MAIRKINSRSIEDGAISAGDVAAGSITTAKIASSVTLTTPTIDTITSAAATALTLKSAGTTAVTIDTSQNVGIGTTSPVTPVTVATTGNFSGNGVRVVAKASPTAYFNELKIQNDGTVGGVIDAGGSSNNYLSLQVQSTERVRITSAGLVGIGQSSPASMLDVFGSTNATAAYTAGTSMPYLLRLFNSASGVTGLTAGIQLQTRSGDQSGALWNIGAVAHSGGSYSNLVFQQQIASSYVEAARFDISGNFVIGKTTTGVSTQGFGVYSTGEIEANAGTNPAAYFNRTNDGTITQFRRSGTTVGTISVTTSATAYNTSSDYRLKKDITPITGALTKVQELKPVTYKWKSDNSNGEGFIAHELAEVCPQAVHGEKDAVDEDGNPVYQGIDVSFLVATLTAAIQELKAENDALKARLDAAGL